MCLMETRLVKAVEFHRLKYAEAVEEWKSAVVEFQCFGRSCVKPFGKAMESSLKKLQEAENNLQRYYKLLWISDEEIALNMH